MSSFPYYQKQDLRQYLSTAPESAQGVAVAADEFDVEAQISDTPVQEAIKRTPHSLCGGELHTASTDEKRDAELPLRFIATPDLLAWWGLYWFGCRDEDYTIVGAADPWLHRYVPLPPGAYRPRSFTLIEGVKGKSKWFVYRGGLVPQGLVRGSIDGDVRLQIQSGAEFAGERVKITDFDPPECQEEEAYRFPDSTISFGKLGQAAFAGLHFRSVEFSQGLALESRDEAQRSGQFIVSRDRGDRRDLFRARVSVIGEKDDDTDLAFHEGDDVFLNWTCPHPSGAGRDFRMVGQRFQIVTKTEGFSTTVNKSTHDFELLGFRYGAGAYTQYPFYMEIETGRDSYKRVPA